MAAGRDQAPAVTRKTLLVLWVLSLLPAAGFVWLVERSDAEKASFVSRARGTAEGTVVRLVEERGKHLRHVPVVTFAAADGRVFTFKALYGDYATFGEKRYPVGAKVRVLYVPEDPSRAEVDDPRLRPPDARPFRIGGAIYAGFMTAVFGGIARLVRPKGGAQDAPLAPS